MTRIRILMLLFIVIVLQSCSYDLTKNETDLQIAFMADVHLQDIYGKLSDSDYKGVYNAETGLYTLARTMGAQLHSTRLFNENYFAFLAALDDVVKRDVKYVVLPGDFSDDGQPLNVRGLKRILDEYSSEYGIHFIVTTGNHDPVRPFSLEAGKNDFLGKGGKEQAIMSQEGLFTPKDKTDLQAIVTSDIRNMGYSEVIDMLGEYGFYPQKNNLYWETPFTNYTYEEYQYEKAINQSSLQNRIFTMPPNDIHVPDVSYLVEPIDGVWFLAIDANVYLPINGSEDDPMNPLSFEGASIGYNNVMTHKKHLLKWIEKITSRAERMGKTLIVFSHYPMIDFNDDASAYLSELLGKNKMQLQRVPCEDVAQAFADAGIKLHFGGHMHINDTGIRHTKKENFLVNVQIPSLAAYVPAYKLLTVKNMNQMEVQTIVLDSVPRFNELFPLYRMEYEYLEKSAGQRVWDQQILQAKSYKEFTLWHLKELVRLRFLPNDWAEDFKDYILYSTGKELLMQTNSSILDSVDIRNSEFENWTGFDLIYDFYRLRNADQLAFSDIGEDRIKEYKLLTQIWAENSNDLELNNQLKLFGLTFQHFLNGAPSDHFVVDYSGGEVVELNEDR
ncbi:metallophosphoesterase [Sunxiuqinia sp. A32]|uniref:metallophosphoesterase n=1 Tax=Sunxiuqinia sp. A32 TaxID=3461496 RepID=UPI004045DC0F